MVETKKDVSVVQVCDKCGEMNYDNVGFCQGCGNMLKDFTHLFCQVCGAKNPVENKVCNECKTLI